MHHHLKRGVVAFISSAILTSCMVGPDFKSPCSPQTKTYTERPQPKRTAQINYVGKGFKTQHFIPGRDLPGEWWRLFRSPAINRLVSIGIKNSPTIAAAKAAVRQAQETLYAQIGASMVPAFDANLSGQRSLTPAASAAAQTAPSASAASRGGIFNLFNATVNVSYTLDIFGGLRRQIESLGAQVDFQEFELEAAYLTLTSNIVTTAITTAALREQIKSTYDLIRYQRETLRIVRGQFELGGASKADLLLQENQLATTLATLPPLQQSLSVNLHALSVLLGELPSHDKLPRIDLESLNLPADLPLSLTTLLVRQRPDIRASEALLHSAMAQIGVATANLYPQVNLTGAYGWQAAVASSLGRTYTNMWNYAAALAQPLFHGGSLLATRRATIAAYQQALANYHLTVLQGFQNVADTLRALVNDANALKAQKQAEIAALQSLKLTQMQLKLGGVNFLALLISQRQYQQARLLRIRAQAARYTDTVALFQSLGGGWWRRPPAMNPCCGIIRAGTAPIRKNETTMYNGKDIPRTNKNNVRWRM